jgi:hypothetical protein
MLVAGVMMIVPGVVLLVLWAGEVLRLLVGFGSLGLLLAGLAAVFLSMDDLKDNLGRDDIVEGFGSDEERETCRQEIEALKQEIETLKTEKAAPEARRDPFQGLMGASGGMLSVPDDISGLQRVKRFDPGRIVEEELRKLKPGKILHTMPDKMKVGITELVEARIAPRTVDHLKKNLHGSGMPQVRDIKVGNFMLARLQGRNFRIVPMSEEQQFVSADTFTEWLWEVTPLASDKQKLTLSVAVRVLWEGSQELRFFPVFMQTVTVEVNYAYVVKKFIRDNWDKIFSLAGKLGGAG